MDLLIRSFSFSRLESMYCVQAITMLEGRLQRQRARAVPGSATWKALGDELEVLMSLRNRFNFGGSDASTLAQSSPQGEFGEEVSSQRQSDQGG